MRALPTMRVPQVQAAAPAAMPQSGKVQQAATATIAPAAALAKIRLQFPEVMYNNIVKVQGEARVEVKLGDSMTRYIIEAFALSPETMDWQRAETTLEAMQPVYGELTVAPFVFPGDPVMSRLNVGATSGSAIVEVRHDGEVLPLFLDDGSEVTPGLPIPAGSVVCFPVRPGAITATVRDARKDGIDGSERYVTEPGKLRHIMRRLRLLTPGDEVTMQEQHLLEIKPLPGLERPFQFFVEGAAKYPFG
jgi:Alpha-2-macroglobulin family